MAPFGCQCCGISCDVDRLLFPQQRGDRLEGYTEIDILTIADTPLDATTMIGGSGDALYPL